MNSIPFSYEPDCEFYSRMEECLLDEKVDNISIITHARPDGDTVGSAYALAYILLRNGKKAQVVCNDTISDKFDYITELTFPEFTPECAVTVDVAAPELIGTEIDLPVICAIDHHTRNNVDAKVKFVKSDKGACGEIIFEFAVFTDAEFDEYLAKCLYTAIATDTGCFKYESVTESTFLAAAYLSRYIPRETAAKLNLRHFDTKSMGQLKVEKYALENLHMYFGNTLGICTVTDELKEELGVSDEDMECLSQLARQIDTVETSVSIKPKGDGVFKISVRTKEYVDAALLCSRFGGGGHKRAAGCTISGTAQEAEEKIVNMYRETVIQR
ncbi:MAG: bifunctional oligoribonuclease/PAP phosphatase NrnA [Ruminococcaceae bacterium]|nr:bifunctional oligoribonuclease/PAP phosphatase NrnA [Oscillospiraceae bacterium]